MLPLVAMLQMQFNDAADLACVNNASAEATAYRFALAAALAIPLTLWYRTRAAIDGLQTVWAAIALLTGTAQVIASLFLVAPGCLSGHALAIFLGCASPWLVVASLFRSAVIPLPKLSRDDGAPPA